MNAVIYARYSSHYQTESSIEGQLKACYEYAKLNDFTVIGKYVDLAMARTNDNRKQFQKMIKDSKRKKFQAVIVYQLDRFARNRYDSAIYKHKLRENDVTLFSVKETDDASGILMESVLEGMMEYYSIDLRKKAKKVNNKKKSKKRKKEKLKQLVNEG